MHALKTTEVRTRGLTPAERDRLVRFGIFHCLSLIDMGATAKLTSIYHFASGYSRNRGHGVSRQTVQKVIAPLVRCGAIRFDEATRGYSIA